MADANDAEAASENYPEEYLVGILLYNRGDYFESHEAWERLWRATAGPKRAFLQGLIQISVALCHFFNGNALGARRLYRSGSAYLAPFAPKHRGLDLDRHLAGIDRCFGPILDADPQRPVPFDEDAVPAIELDPPPMAWPEIPDWVYGEEDPPS